MPTHTRTLPTLLCTLCLLALTLFTSACARSDNPQSTSGHLMVIGGGLERDNAPVYQHILKLAQAASPQGQARVVIATAASADEAASEKSARAAFALYDPNAIIACITRETPADETVAALSLANAVFFTGGDQKRITARYRPDPSAKPSVELLALREVLNRGGVIAGTSAGAAMMSDIMFLGGRSIDALGYPRQSATAAARSTQTDDPDNPASPDEPAPAKGPSIAHGMGFIRTLITDSHFIERNRIGRLVAALEASNLRLGLGVAENACVHINLHTGEIVGISAAASQLIDIGSMHREGPARRNAHALTLNKDTRVNINDLLRSPIASRPPHTAKTNPPINITAAEGEINRAERRLLSLRIFERAASASPNDQLKLILDGWQITTRQAHRPGTTNHTWISFDIEPTTSTNANSSNTPASPAAK